MRLPVCQVAIVALVIWSAFPLNALAHAELLGSEPAAGSSLEQAPAQVTLYFSEAVAPGLTDISLLDARGRRIDRVPARIEGESARVVSAEVPELQPGVYTISFRALS